MPLIVVASTRLARKPSIWSDLGRALSRLSMGIYLVHVFIQQSVNWSLGALGLIPDTLLAYRYSFVITLALSALIVEALSRLPGAALLLGVPRRRRQASRPHSV